MRWTRLPMGLRSGPALWTANMVQDVIKPVRTSYHKKMRELGRLDEAKSEPIGVYLDDIFLTTVTTEDHLILLDITFNQLAKMKLTLSVNKCFIGRSQINLLGSTVTGHAIKVQPERIRALQEVIPPRNIYELRGWIGALRYLANHIPKLSLILARFDEQTGSVPATKGKIAPVRWTQELVDDFKEAQNKIIKPEVLFHIRSDLPMFIESDASGSGFGATLFQTEPGKQPPFDKTDKDVFPLAYYAHKWSKSQKAYHACTKELRALHDAMKKWQPLLGLGTSLTVLTDNTGVVGLLTRAQDKPKNPSPYVDYQRWLNNMTMFADFSVMHLTTKEVFTSDGLSRSAWMELAADDDDLGVWPVAAPAVPRKLPRDVPVSKVELSTSLIKHCRHEQCPHVVDGVHPWKDLQAILLRDTSVWVPIPKIRNVLTDSERRFFTERGGSYYGSLGRPAAAL